jgi:hypothetical protein
MMKVLRVMLSIILWFHVWNTVCMFHKTQRPENNEGTADGRLRQGILNRFLLNGLSAEETQQWLNDGAACNLKAFENYTGVIGGKNTHRNLMKKCMRHAKGWPNMYHANITVLNKRTNRATQKPVALLLPHEILHCMAVDSNISHLCSTTRLSVEDKLHYDRHAALWGGSLVPVGLWMDGTPCNFDRSDTLESVTISLPGNEALEQMRIPICGVLKRHMVNEQTIDDILAVVAWSFRCAADGHFPVRRHDGSPFRSVGVDAIRAKQAGTQLAVKALCTEVRGDWKMYKETLRLPGWQEKHNCCYKCHADKEAIKDSSAHAAWRKSHLTFQDFARRVARKGLSMSPLFDIPGMSLDRIKIDWLHCADLGVAPEFEGNLMWHLVQKRKVPGRNQAQRIDAIFQHIQASGVGSTLPVLTKGWFEDKDVILDPAHVGLLHVPIFERAIGMIWKDNGSGPKLRAQGHEARTLIRWCKAACNEFLSDFDPIDAAIKTACYHLVDCYECLDRNNFAQPRLANSCRKFSLQLQALRVVSHDSRLWRFKPKHHMFQHLAEESLDCPTMSWCYRDEGFGGSLAQLVRSRGGVSTPRKVSTRMLSFFMANNRLPWI